MGRFSKKLICTLDLAIAPRFDISVADIDDNLFSKDFRLTSELCSS